ncbi:MAG: preprotein translocase subunit Sec61beta [Candidatus Marsarchaeota archaeon]|jgi:preprotein translocase subunit Sec61beta
MSKKRKREGPAPMTAAGLVRYYEEDKGINFRPSVVIGIAVAFSVIVALADAGFFGFIKPRG